MRLAFLVAALAVLPPPAVAFEPGDDVSYTAGGASRTGVVIARAGGRDLYPVSRNGSETQYALPGSRLMLRQAGPPDPLEQRVTVLEGRADDVRADVDALRADLVSLEGAVDQLEQRVAALKAQEPPPPSSVVYVAPTEGAQVSGVTPVRVRAPAGTDWIGVYACGRESVGEDLIMDANGEWSVQWDTQTCSNGPRGLDTWAFRDDGSNLGNATITAEVSNSSPPPPDPGPTPCEPSAEPEPVAGQGYVLRFSDCFGTLSRTVWCSNQWWEPNPPLGTQYVSDGVLHLVRRRSDGYPNVTVSSEPCGQANPQSFRRGYFESRLRWTGAPGSGPAFWLFSTAHATNPRWPRPACPEPTCLSAEIDVFEGYGNHLDVFTGAIHRNSCDCYGEPSRMNSNNLQPQPGTNLSGWHVYAVRWTSTDVTWYLDDRRIMSAPVYDSTDQPMHLLFYNWGTPWQGGNETGAATPDQLHTEVDWVRVWQQ
jgi:hypothetical protein